MTAQDQGGAQGVPAECPECHSEEDFAAEPGFWYCERCGASWTFEPTAPAASPADEGQAGEAEALAPSKHAVNLMADPEVAMHIERLVAEARAEALRNAADEMPGHTKSDYSIWDGQKVDYIAWEIRPNDNTPQTWLRARADSHDTGSERGKS